MKDRARPSDTSHETDGSPNDTSLVEIKTLGGLDIRFCGKSLIESRSSLRRVLELLKYLIAWQVAASSEDAAGEETFMENAEGPRESPVRPAATNTFLVKVLYTQRTTVQGILHWVEQGRSLPFRSFLEMVHLLGEAIQTRQDMDQLKTWREGKSLQSKWR